MLPNDGPESSPTPLYQSDLAQTPLPEILVTIHRYRAPGIVECRRGAEVKSIYLEGGEIIYASSNQIRDSLGDQLLRQGRISQEQYDESVRLLATTGKRQGTILTEMRALDPRELFVMLHEHIRGILWSVFGWDFGTVSFRPGRDKHLEFVKVQIPVPQALMEGIRRMPDPRALVARLGAKATLFDKTGAVVHGLTLDADEQRLLDLVDGRRTLYELTQTPSLPAP
ncbi:MAG TPA: DUF4388 domain-containing protein, partial [Thermoanaerobaculia bacterium]|nr:DUF4388 domain-containing protein [Thermoanaerobaculia bacterium]